ncbi:S8 family peptidase [Streptomyces bambusae]|uniref:S8 family serine peptidase n=1 Tax=Streptomyces bambusae TaxID=1550616 RepID=A0ABS6Z0G7_9ACTN|nr:S8 family peptidase [Streptomyces bambusae]MBW5481228.1 S8 family serine peptidase [Streptomyces bambusae]
MRLLARLATATLLATAPLAAGTASAAGPEPTPVPLHTSANAVPGQYIVTLDKGVDAAKTAAKLGLKPTFVYNSAIRGFAGPLTKSQLDLVRVSPGVKAVEEDARVQATPLPSAPGSRAPSASWGLDRIDQRHLPLDNDFTTAGNGSGVNAYILDTGIDYGHTEFRGRAALGFDAMGDGRGGQDCNGHGTHVAGTVGGSTYGVARKANLISVRVLGCDGTGSWSGIIAGMDWVARNAKGPAVLNGSLGGDRSDAVNNAANAVADAGVLPVIAAGNSAIDACRVSPASAARVLTVGATNRWDEETSFSNYGTCLDLYAPGQDIVSAKLGGGSVALNGTSMAAPHVAGLATLYKGAYPAATPAEVADWLDSKSTKDDLTNLGNGSPNKLLFTAGF